jgi:hypothetical protein
MNDLERDIREMLLRHQGDVPMSDVSEARRVASRVRRRELRNVVGAAIAAVVVIVAVVGVGGLVRADRPPAVIDQPTPSPTCTATAERPATKVHGWPDGGRNKAGVYSWGNYPPSDSVKEGWMHNAYPPGSGQVEIFFRGVPGIVSTHPDETAATVAGCEGTYFVDELGDEWWMVDIQGTTVMIIVEPGGAPKPEVDEAHEIVESIIAVPHDNAYGFQLLFTLTTNTWDSG